MREQVVLMLVQKMQGELDNLMKAMWAAKLDLVILVETLKHAGVVTPESLQATVARLQKKPEAGEAQDGETKV